MERVSTKDEKSQWQPQNKKERREVYLSDFFRYVAEKEPLSAEKELEYWKEIESLNIELEREKDPTAQTTIRSLLHQKKEEIIHANLRLILSVAKRYRDKDISLLELVSEGVLGAMDAIERFDYKKGYRFSTYGIWWIKLAISKTIAEQGGTIKIPIHLFNLIKKLQKNKERIESDLGERVSYDEVAAMTDDISQKRVSELLNLRPQNISSLDIQFDGSGGSQTTLVDHLKDPHMQDSPAYILERDDMQVQLDKLLSLLSPKERSVIQMRFGLGNRKSGTLDEIGLRLGLTRERVRQIQMDSIKKLQESPYSNEFRELLP